MESPTRRALCAGLVLVLATVLVGWGSVESRGRLEGTVLDASNEKAIPGAEVFLVVAGERRITDVNGRFSFGDMDVGGPDTLVIRHFSYDSLTIPIESPDLPDVDLDFLMSPAPLELRGIDVAVDGRVREEAFRLAKITNGFFWDRQDFQKHVASARHIADVLRWSGKVSYVREGNDGYRCVIIRLSAGCAQILVNNVFVNQESLAGYAPEDIQSYVVIDPINATTLYGTGASAGVVVVYIRGGGGR
jgi:carboxypeptidase-like protein